MAASWRQLEDVKIFSAIFNSVPEKTGFWFAPYIGQGWGNALKKWSADALASRFPCFGRFDPYVGIAGDLVANLWALWAPKG